MIQDKGKQLEAVFQKMHVFDRPDVAGAVLQTAW